MKISQKTKKTILTTVCAIVAATLIAGLTMAILMFFNHKDDEEEGPLEENITSIESNYNTTEEENETTKKITSELINVEIGDVEEIGDENGTSKAVVVTVKNISDQKLSVAVDIVAKDAEGNALDIASLYAEGMRPDEIQTFNTFVMSSLTVEQLKNATFEVHRAYTYVTNDAEGEEVTEEVVETETLNTEETIAP